MIMVEDLWLWVLEMRLGRLGHGMWGHPFNGLGFGSTGSSSGFCVCVCVCVFPISLDPQLPSILPQIPTIEDHKGSIKGPLRGPGRCVGDRLVFGVARLEARGCSRVGFRV